MAVIPLNVVTSPYRFNPTAPTVGRPVVTADRVVVWSANNGATVSPSSGSSVTTVTTLNRSQVVTIGAVSGADSGSIPVIVWGTWPVQPRFGYELALDNKTLASYAEDGSVVFAKKGPTRRSWKLSFPDIPEADWILIRDFWNWHEKHLPFYYEDLASQENVGGVEVPTLRLVTMDSGLSVTVAGPNRYNITVQLREF